MAYISQVKAVLPGTYIFFHNKKNRRNYKRFLSVEKVVETVDNSL